MQGTQRERFCVTLDAKQVDRTICRSIWMKKWCKKSCKRSYRRYMNQQLYQGNYECRMLPDEGRHMHTWWFA